MPAVSVVIPAYNCQDFIATAVDSALRQSYKDFEIIAVNDGSTDNTKNILEKFKDKIKIIDQANGGPASARNTGVLNAMGEYIAFLDQDDAWFPEKLEMQMGLFGRDNGLGLVCSDAYIIDGKVFDKSDHSPARYFTASPPSRGNVFAELFSKSFIATSTVIVRKSCFDKAGLFDPALTPIEDYDRWLRISFFYKVDFVDKPLVKYRDHVATFRRDPMRALTNIINTYNGIGHDYPEARDTLGAVFYRVIAKYHISLGERYLFIGDIKNALRNFSAAIKMTKSYKTGLRILFSVLRDYPAVCVRFVKRSLSGESVRNL